jgi:iron(III) transport system ATP-binding protein
MSFIKIENLNFSYNKTSVVLDNISFELNKGEIGVLVGPSGSGKSTLLRCLAGFEKPQSGQISIANTIVYNSLTWLSASQRNVGFLFQNLALFPHMNVQNNILFGISHLTKIEQKHRLEELLTLINLKGYNLKKPEQLSGGEKQRVALARSLAPKPALLIMDEPFSSLDPDLRQSMREEVKAILKAQNMTALVVTHEHQEAYDLADQLGVIEKSKLTAWGNKEDLFKLENRQVPVLNYNSFKN